MLSSRIETNAIVPHGKLKSAATRAKLDLDRAGVGMARDVAKGLLGDPIQTKGNGLRRLADALDRSEARWNSLHGSEPRALGLQRLDQSEIFENSRMKRIG